MTEIVCVQNLYNVAHRGDDAFIDQLAKEGVAYVPFFPLGGFSPLQSSTLSEVAAAAEATPMQVALAWLLQRSPNVLLIPGTSSVAHLRENSSRRRSPALAEDGRAARLHRRRVNAGPRRPPFSALSRYTSGACAACFLAPCGALAVAAALAAFACACSSGSSGGGATAGDGASGEAAVGDGGTGPTDAATHDSTAHERLGQRRRSRRYRSERHRHGRRRRVAALVWSDEFDEDAGAPDPSKWTFTSLNTTTSGLAGASSTTSRLPCR